VRTSGMRQDSIWPSVVSDDAADPDAVMERVLALKATVVHPLVDQTEYPSRDFTVADPDGNYWSFATFFG